MTVCIVFQLTRDAVEYDEFFQKVEEASEGNFRQITDGCILANSRKTPAALRKELLVFLRPDDRLFLSQFGRECCGQLPEKAKQWLKRNVFMIDP